MQKVIFAGAHYGALAVFVWSCWGYGRALLWLLSPPSRRDAWIEAAMAVATGMGLSICAFQALAIIGIFRSPATIALIAAGALAAALQWLPWWRSVKLHRDAASLALPCSPFEKIAIAALVLVALPALVEPLAPPLSFDEVMYHLPYARRVAQEGSLGIYEWLRYPWFPYNYNLLYAAALQMGDDVLPHLLSALAGGLSAVMVYRIGICHADRMTACIGAAIWVGLGDYRSALADMGTTLFVLAACVAMWWWRTCDTPQRDASLLGLSAFFLGLAAGSKYQALTFLPGVVAWVATRERRPKVWLCALVCFLVPCAYWYVRNAVMTGDPFNPVGGPLFGFTDWTAADYATQVQDVRANARMPSKLLWPAVLAPCSIMWKRSAAIRAAGWFCLYAVLVWAATSRYPRYLMAAFPLLALMAALGWQVLFSAALAAKRRIFRTRGDNPTKDGGLRVALLLLAGLAVAAFQHLALNAAAISPTAAQREAYLSEHLPGYAVMDYARRHATGRVYQFALSEAVYYGPDPVWGDDALGPWRGHNFAGLSSVEMARKLRAHGFEVIVVSAAFAPHLVNRPAFLEHFTLLYENNGSQAYRVLDGGHSPS